MRVRNRFFWVAAIVGLVLDQLTKLWVVRTFELTVPPDTIPLWPGVFHFTYVTNSGAAFSLFSNNGEWLRWLSLIVSLALIVLGLFFPLADRWEEIGYGLILSGALGNGVDRFFNGEVVDFLNFRLIRFPIFNIADVCINIGIVCLIIAALRAPNNGEGSGTGGKKINS
jgi:signal peptidase II